jgi:hypothetical protein
MAASQDVKDYLACWFQLGKKVVFPKTEKSCCPVSVLGSRGYSQEFERLWAEIQQSPQDCYLEGTDQSVKELLSEVWEIVACARCTLPVPAGHAHIPCPGCPCADLDLWPNLDLPLPHLPVNGILHLQRLQCRLLDLDSEDA